MMAGINKKWALIVVLPVLSVFLAGCSREEAPKTPIKTVTEGRVEQCGPVEGPRYTTALVPASRVDLVFKSAGIVESVRQVRGADGRTRDIQPGDKVGRGTVLARVRPEEYEQQVAKARAGLASAEAQLAQAKAAFDEADLSFKRARSLFESASLTQPQYDQAKARREAAAAGVEGAEAGLEGARTSLKLARVALDDTVMRSPMDGWVLARNLEKGSLAGNTGPGLSIIDTHVVKASFSVPDTELKAIKTGRGQEVIIEALARPVRGIITAVSPAADPKSRVFLVEVTLANPHEEMRPGMIGKLTLSREKSAPAHPVVPLEAVVPSPDRPGGYAVFAIREKDGKTYALAKNIRIGTMYGDTLEVIEGAAPGDRIVVTGASMVRNGEEIRVLGRAIGVKSGA
jgi:RND family efflux transporter MFP subunit